MIRFLFQKLTYGFLVLFGVITVVFFLFNLSPGDPVRNLVGENASEKVVETMRRKLDLDLPAGKRFVLYLNDLSPLSIHNSSDPESRIYLDSSRYSYIGLFSFSKNRTLVAKKPYLKRSFLSDKNVSEILSEVMPGTVILAVVSIALSLILGLFAGVIAALKKDTFYDRLLLFVSAIGMSGPSFFVAIIVAWIGAILWRDQIPIPWLLVFALLFGVIALFFSRMKRKFISQSSIGLLKKAGIGFLTVWAIAALFLDESSFLNAGFYLPGTGLNMTGSLYSVDVWKGEYLDLKNMILPVITLMIRPLSVIVQLTRSSLLDVLQQDFIRTARAKGITEFRVIARHALRNALNPVITAVSGWFASLLAGAVFVEFVFGWKGLGQQMFTAIESRDMPVVMGGVIVIATAFVLINILVDILYGWIDPRVRIS
ncbi:MAG: ABC transporter permease [Flavobacteriales bacterium]